jgi:broad specificity phosphatase PhoE
MALQCAATLLISRHGEADFEQPHLLSDSGGWLTELGRAQARELAERVADRRIATVYASPQRRAVESAEAAAEVLNVPVRTVAGLEEYSVGDLAGRPGDDPELRAVLAAWGSGHLDTRIPGGESGAEVVQRYREALESIADQHRGETVLVFSHGGVMSLCLPRLDRRVLADLGDQDFVPNCAPVEVAIGDDGIHLVSWPGHALPGSS